MKNIIATFLLPLFFGCALKDSTTSVEPITPVLKVSMYNSPLIDYDVAVNHPYDVDFMVKKTTEGQFSLITWMQLYGGSFYVSPHSITDFKGRFAVEVAPNEDLVIEADFLETPRSIEVIDPHRFVNGPVNWVSEDTRYDYPLTIKSKKDFDIGGKLMFVIEPKCTLEEIPLMFKYRSGVLTVEKWEC